MSNTKIPTPITTTPNWRAEYEEKCIQLSAVQCELEHARRDLAETRERLDESRLLAWECRVVGDRARYESVL